MSERDMNSAAEHPSCCRAREKTVSRRDFIDMFIKGGLLVTLAGMVLPALNYVWPVTRRGPAGGLQEVGKLDDIPVGGAQKITLAGSALILLRTPNEVKAFSAVCTHLGCLVDWDGRKREIMCPCHAGTFDINGRVVSGPPPKPLPEHAVKVIDGKIFVTV
jgi:cytochrome b6-f complex iron-sulfur subunit